MKQLILITLIWLFTAPTVNAEVLYSHKFTNSQSTICYREGKAMLCYSPSKHKHMRHQRMIPMSNSHVVQQTHQQTHQQMMCKTSVYNYSSIIYCSITNSYGSITNDNGR
jgi:hypothetical protein